MSDVIVVRRNTEVAEFSDGSTVLRQRSYINKHFAPLREKHRILTPDQFRLIFTVGSTIKESIDKFKDADDMGSDGDPGGRQYKGMSVPKKD